MIPRRSCRAFERSAAARPVASRRLELGPDWWFAIVPESDDAGAAVTCLYRIFPARRAVDASLLATLKRPIV